MHEFRQIGKRITTLSPTSKGTTYRDTMTRLSILLEEIPCVRLESRKSGQLECKTMVNLSRFKSLQYLEIDEVFPPLIQNLRDKVGPRLVQLICLNSGVTTMRDLLAPASGRDEGAEVEPEWSALSVFDCSYNQLVVMDESLHALKNVTRMTLAHNLIRKVENLEHCHRLSLLDLGFNKIESVQDIHIVLGGLKTLVLRHNQLRSTLTLEKLYSLERLDLGGNLIEHEDEIKRLAELPLLVYLNTLGNPVCVRGRPGAARPAGREENYRLYRRDVVTHFLVGRSDINERLQVFDEQPLDEAEIRQALQASTRRSAAPPPDRFTTLSPARNVGSASDVPARAPASPVVPSAGPPTSDAPTISASDDESPAALLRLKPTNAGGMAIASAAGATTSEHELADAVNNQPAGLPAELLVRPKKKKKKRVAVIEAVSSPSASPQRPPRTEPREVTPSRKGATSPRRPLDEAEASDAKKADEGPEEAAASLTTAKSADNEFVAKIEELHKQGGTMWLLALNEMQRKEFEEEQRAKEKELREAQQQQQQQARKAATSPSSSGALAKNDAHQASLRILEEIKTGKILQLSSSPEIAHSLKMGLSSSPDDQPHPASAASPPVATTKVTAADDVAATAHDDPSRSPANSRINLDDHEDTTTDEFTVEIEGQLRILLISKRYVVEADVTTGRDVVSHQAKYITSVQSLAMGGCPAVRVEYAPPRAGMELRTDVQDTAIYVLDEADERDRLADLLQGFVNQNSQARVQCMRCLKIYDRLAGMQTCRSCGSTYLVHYEEEKKPVAAVATVPRHSISSSISAAASSSASTLAQSLTGAAATVFSGAADLLTTGATELVGLARGESLASAAAIASTPAAAAAAATAAGSVKSVPMQEDFSSETMDVNLQLHLRLTFFRGGADEQLVYFFTSVFLPYGARAHEETVGHLLLTTQNLYILQRKRRPTESDPGFALVAEYRLSQIRRLVIGLFYQYFRVEADERQAFVFLPKEHARTHAFIDLFLQSLLAAEEKAAEPIEAVHYNSETLANMQTQLLYRFPDKTLHVYALLYHRLPSARPRSMLLSSALAATRDMGGWMTRALIVTGTHIVLATEDYSRWPALHYPSVKPPSSPQFELVSAHEVAELVSMDLDAQDTTEFKLVFEKESTGARATLQLKTEHENERSKLSVSLAKMWESLFKLPLPIKYYNIPV